VLVALGATAALVAPAACSDGGHGPRVLPTTTTRVVVPPGFTIVDGTATTVHLAPAGLDQIALGSAIHIELLVRGAASASLPGVTVNGTQQTIAWPGGTPLDLHGPGATITTPLTVDVDGHGALVQLDTGVIQLEAGAWQLDGSVAVGRGGLGQPQDHVAFTVPTGGAAISFRGGAGLRLPAADRTLEGPGRVEVHGHLTVHRAAGETSSASFRFGPGPYRIELSAAGTTLRVHLTAETP